MKKLTPTIVYNIGRAYCEIIKPIDIVIGGDIRDTSDGFKQDFIRGVIDSGVNVINLGVTGTEEIYFATNHFKVGGGVEITASHNPIDYNGIKMVKRESIPLTTTDIRNIQKRSIIRDFETPLTRGTVTNKSCVSEYINHVMGFIDVDNIKPMKIVVDPGNGTVGHIITHIEKLLPMVEFIKINFDPDPTFPNGIPNPLLHDMRSHTSNAVKLHKADLGIAWDGDFDRCFFFDNRGEFVEGYYIVGLLADMILRDNPSATIIHDPRLTWNTIDVVNSRGGIPIQSKTGHAFIKEAMRSNDAVYGGEMSAHHYFKDFFYCDSGIIPWLLVMELMSVRNNSLDRMIIDSSLKYPISGELNFKLNDMDGVLDRITHKYIDNAIKHDNTDGTTFEFDDWRFNIRSSNTEPILRLNVESKSCKIILKEKTDELTTLIRDLNNE